MARAGPVKGSWICNFCERILHESEFALDAYKTRTNRPPGRCRDCDLELARARGAMSRTGKVADCGDNSTAYHLAKETCRAHAWGKGWYRDADIAAARARAERIRGKQEGVQGLTAGERRADEARRLETREREQAAEARELDKRAANRTGNTQKAAKVRTAAQQAAYDRVKERRRAAREGG